MELQQFLEGLVAGSAGEVAATAAAVGLLVFSLIEGVDVLVKRKNGVGLNSDLKFWSALVLSFGVPLGAYSGLQAINNERIELNGLFLACGVGYAASQIVHRGKDIITKTIQNREAKARVEETNKMASERLTYYTGSIPQGHTPPTLPIAPAAPTFTDGERSADTVDLSNSGDVQPYKGM